MNFSSREYLPNSEQRVEHLRRIIDGRPVAILAAGPSIQELEDRIDELRNVDICYFGFNSFVQETHILQKISKCYSVYADPCGENLPKTINDVIRFLERPDDNMLISTFGRNNDTFSWLVDEFDLNRFLDVYNEKLVFFGISYDRTVPNKDQLLHFISGNTLQMVIQMAVIGKASKIVLFGADGGCKSNIKEHYYRQGECEFMPLENLIMDTNICFNPIMPLAIRNVYKTYNLPPIEILNCSEHSYYGPFPKISYDDAFEYLLTDKKFNSKSDLRIPKLSVISTALNTKDFLRETVENLTEESYPNLEHIIVYNEEGDDIKRLKRQLSQARWIYEKGCKPLAALRKGISVARGENVCYCPVGDIFANPDWLNISMDILENHPDISLVWGLSQAMAENGAAGRIINPEFFDNPPPQGKDFIYYWLKKKTSFPEGAFCVRKSVLEDCFPFNDGNIADERKAWLSFNYNFNTSGYLPFFVPLVANYHRTCFDQGGHRPQGDPVKMHLPYYVPITEEEQVCKQVVDESWNTMLDAYHDDIRRYRNSLLRGKVVHRFKNRFGEELPGNFSRVSFLFGDIKGYAKRKVPDKCTLVCKKILGYWRRYRWGMFKAGMVRIVERLIRIGAQKMSKQKDSVL